MLNSIPNTKEDTNTDSKFGTTFVHKNIMPDIRIDKRNVWDILMDAISPYIHRIRNCFFNGYTNSIRKDMYATSISAKIALLFLAGIETFLVQNTVVQWIVTVFILVGLVMWLYSYNLTIQKKNLILNNTSKEETKKWMKIAKNIRLQHDIDWIIARCFVAACIFLILFIINSNQN